jgi:hypothetical protein
VHEVISPAALVGYNNGSAVMTLVLPLGFFIVVMIALYFVFTRPHAVPGHRPVSGARPVPPDTEAAPGIAAATGFPLATSTGGTEPLAHRATPPAVGATAEAATEVVKEGAEAAKDAAAKATGDQPPAESAGTARGEAASGGESGPSGPTDSTEETE